MCRMNQCGILSAVADIHPWTWIAAIYGVQLIASVVAVRLFNLPLTGMMPPLLILLLGALAAMAFRWFENQNSTIKWKWLLPALIYGGFIFSLSHRSFPGAKIPVDTGFFHPLEFMTLGIFLCRLAHPILEKRGKTAFAAIILVTGGIFGVIDEIHQAWIPGRKSDPLDVVLDIVGLGLGMTVFFGALSLKRFVKAKRSRTDRR